MELDEPKQTRPPSSGYEGPNKQNGERNLATRRHTVGPSETAHDQVIGKHLKLEQAASRGTPTFYPTVGFTGLGYSPLNLPSHMVFNPLAGMSPIADIRPGFLPNFDFNIRSPIVVPSALNAQFPTISNIQDTTGAHHGGKKKHSIFLFF